MSGLEGIAALGLACNVLQLIGSVATSVTVAKNILDTGTIDPALAERNEELSKLYQDVEISLAKVGPSGNDQELRDVAGKILQTTTELKTELAAVSGSPSKGKMRRMFGGTIKAMLKRSKLERLEEQAMSYQKTFETRLLLSLRSHFDLAAQQQRVDIARLENSLRAESQEIKQKQLAAVHAATLSQLAGEKKTICESLRYEEVNERRNQVEDAHIGTFEWIFQESENLKTKEHRRWSDIPDFIRSPDDKLYWVSGKPGSGKSTLMKFLLNNVRIKEIMKQTSCPGSFITISHFIWASGTAVQKSLRGTLASLLSQIVDRSISENDSDCLCLQVPGIHQRRSLGDWSNEDLAHALKLAISNHLGTVYLLIDGLDEIESTDTHRILAVIDRICEAPNAKCITSSRPEHIFSTHFSKRKAHTLRMQDLTMADIQRYARDSLSAYFQETQTLEEVVQNLCEKAEGVFLWVALAVKSQQLGALNMDDPEELALRLDQLPRGLSELYCDMWDRLNENKEIYGKQGARYLNLMILAIRLLNISMDLSTMLFATRPELRYKLFQPADPSFLGELEVAREKLIVWVTIRSAGLIEDYNKNGYHCLGFVHRSAVEFLENTQKGLEIRGLDKSLPGDSVLSLMEAMLAVIRHDSDADRLDTTIAHRPSWSNRIHHYDICRYQFSLEKSLELAFRLFDDGHVSYGNYISLLAHAESTYNAFLLLAQKYPHRVCSLAAKLFSSDFVGYLASLGYLECVSVKFAEYSIQRKISPAYLEYIMTEICYNQLRTSLHSLVYEREIARLKRLREWLFTSHRGPWYSRLCSLFGGCERTTTGLIRTRLLGFLQHWIAYTHYAFESDILPDIIQGIPSDHRVLFKVPWPRSSTKIEPWGPSALDHFYQPEYMHIYVEVPVKVLIPLRSLHTLQPPPADEEYRNFVLNVITEGTEDEKPSALFIETSKGLPTSTEEAKIFHKQFFRLKTKEDREYVTEAVMLEFVQGHDRRIFPIDKQPLTDLVEKRLEEDAFDQTSLADFESVLVERGHGYYPNPMNPWPPAVSEDFMRQPNETAEAEWRQEIEQCSAQKEREREYYIGNDVQGFRGFTDGDSFFITSWHGIGV